MPLFKVRCHDGSERTVEAHRVCANPTSTFVEARDGARWSTVLEVPTREVAEVRRRVTEIDGRYTWIPQRPLEFIH